MIDPNQTQINYPSFSEDRPINWRKLLFYLFKNSYWFLITIFISIFIIYIKNRYALPEYRVSATVMIAEDQDANNFLNEFRAVRRRRLQSDLTNEVAKLKSFNIAKRSVDSLGWEVSWTAYGRVAMVRPLYKFNDLVIEIDSASKSWFVNRLFYIDPLSDERFVFHNKNGIDTIYHFNRWVNYGEKAFRIIKNDKNLGYASYSFVYNDPSTLARQYRNKLEVTFDDEEGTIMNLSVRGKVARQEIDYLNTFCEIYIQQDQEYRQQTAENRLNFINEQITIILDSLNKTENQLLKYRISENVVDLSREGEIAYTKLHRFYDQKTDLKLRKSYYEYLIDYIENRQDPKAIILPVMVNVEDQLLSQEVSTLQNLYARREQLAFAAEVENPGVIQVNAQIQSARSKILEILQGLLLNNELSMSQIELEEKLIEEKLLTLPLSEQELINIQRKYDVNNNYYTFLLQKRAEAGIQKVSTISNIRVIDTAEQNITVLGERKLLNYVIAFILGIGFPGIIIILINYLDPRIKDKIDIENKTKAPLLGVISHNDIKAPIPVFNKPNASFTEAFRHIRTNLQYILREPDQNVIMITSTVAGEGKTFIAVNLAAILAMNFKKVLLLGLDLRRPSLHKIFNIDNSEGISTYLVDKSDFNDILYKSEVEGLDILPAGPSPPNPAELVLTKKMKDLIDQAKKDYDYIVIDTPPVALVTDALIISQYSSANIFVVRQNFSHKEVLHLINKYYEDNKITNISLLVNDIRYSRSLGYSYYYGYGYEYGYGYGYGYSKYGNKYYSDEKEKSV